MGRTSREGRQAGRVVSASHYAVILAGGKGERFWPLSTARRPKQLLSLVGGKPLIVRAVDRLEGVIPPERVYVITNADTVAATREVAPELPPENIIGEPIGRDTAAAIALGAALVKARDPGGAFCVLTADHIMGDLDVFRSTIREGLSLASREDLLITIGIRPAFASTGYGYIESGESLAENEGVVFLRARRFVEKPDRKTAEEYISSGRFFWNSGMFIWSVRAFASALRKHRPVLADLIERLAPVAGTPGFEQAMGEAYERLEKISIDYALMEKADNIAMARGEFAWDDVGSWTALENHLPRDAAGNVAVGSVEELDASGNIVVSDGRLTALVGVKDMIVVHAAGATLVCRKDKAQSVKKIVEKLRASGRYDEVL